MADDSRSPGVCPWNPDEAHKGGIGAWLPPRKRLLADLKQNGWFSSSSSSSCPQSCNGAGSMEELKLEVDLAETNVEEDQDTCLVEPTAGQGECNAVESSISVKRKKASRRRKSLSVLVDCHASVKELQPESLKSGPADKMEKKFRTNKVSMETVLYSNGGKESAPSYRETVEAARAAAAIAAKAAKEARAIAMDKAAAAAKAAAVAKSALEALALAAYDDEEGGFQSRKHTRALRKHKRNEDKLKQEPKPEFSLPLTEGGNVLSEKRVEEKMGICSVPLDESQDDEQTHIFHVALSSEGMGAGFDKIKEDKGTEAHQVLIVDLASAPSDKIKEDEQTHTNHVASPLPSPLDDEKLARQLHRAINSSPRISRHQATLDCIKKLETTPFSTQGCIQNKYLQAGGCNLSREKKSIHKEKTRGSRTSIGRADVKVRSMSAINETLNMLQGTSPSKYRVLDGRSAASEQHQDNFCVKKDLPLPSSNAFVSLEKCNEEGDKLTAVSGDGASSCEVNVESKSKKASCSGHPHQLGVTGTVEELRSINWSEMIKKRKLSSKLSTGKSLITGFPGMIEYSLQDRDSNDIGEVPAMSAENLSATFFNTVSETMGSHLDTLKVYGQVGRDENQDRVTVPGLGPAPEGTGDSVNEIRNTQENSFCLKSSRTTRKSLLMSSHGDRHTQHQKVLGVLSNGLSKRNQNFGGSMNLSSPTVS